MSDEDERHTNLQTNQINEANNRRLSVIRAELHQLTREKTKYNVEKLTQDIEFLHGEIELLTHGITEINQKINAQMRTKKTLNAQMSILRSTTRVPYVDLQTALQEKQRYEEELRKPGKTASYRDLVQRKISLIIEYLPQLQKHDDYRQQYEQADQIQKADQHKRDKFVESLNIKTRKQTENKQLVHDSVTRLPELEQKIENLRSEREQIINSVGGRKQRRQISPVHLQTIASPVQFFATLERDTLEYEKQRCHDQLEKIRLLLKYFHEKMSEHNVSITNTSCSSPTTELTSPVYHPLTLSEEQTILSSFMSEETDSADNTTNQSTTAIAMKLPRNFIPLNLQSTTTNEIIHSSFHSENSFGYKKELPADIVDKYAGIGKKKQQQQQQQGVHGKKNKKNKKNFSIKHSSHMIYLYNEVRASTGHSDTLPFMPMFEYELSPAVKALQLMEQSVESYLTELSQRDEQHSEIHEEDDIQDSALDSFSETSSLIETTNFSKDFASALPHLTNIPEARSSSSSDDKKTIVSSSSPASSHHSHSKLEQQPSSTVHLTTVEESSPHLPSLPAQITQIERQISDEGYRSIQNGTQVLQTTGATNNTSTLLTRSSSYDCVEKVGKWLSSTPHSSSMLTMDENIHNDFQATNSTKREENLV
ncbi:unnamed protein product [Adineta ricciae]|uniref:Uncharacterized protein n=1 Tax=Adineta ricciae TaxID=249248 RepID=A0A813YN14_ADIRI|nr:unnamed protein product [Adineta ricciae]CAF1248638.1 unnamed protein product [Adineta ricciae]